MTVIVTIFVTLATTTFLAWLFEGQIADFTARRTGLFDDVYDDIYEAGKKIGWDEGWEVGYSDGAAEAEETMEEELEAVNNLFGSYP
jgi:hypothetical protein